MLRSTFALSLQSLALVPVVLAMIGVSTAQVMQSTNYQIDSDSVNVGGGYSESGSYQMESTVGEVATGDSDSTSFSVRAGFQQMQSVQISLSAIDDVSMNPSIPGVSGGTSNGSTTFTVITDNPAGYEVTIAAENSPALQEQSSAATIADYSPSGVTDYTFSLGASDAHMGYTVESAAAAGRFLHSGSVCNTGSTNTAAQCWDGLSTTPATLVTSASANHPAGTEATLHFRVGVGGSVSQSPGTYVATTTVTALPL